jgi:hypothetical protein
MKIRPVVVAVGGSAKSLRTARPLAGDHRQGDTGQQHGPAAVIVTGGVARPPVYALLADGSTVLVRPAEPGDFDAIKAMHEGMSADNL